MQKFSSKFNALSLFFEILTAIFRLYTILVITIVRLNKNLSIAR
jgi:hypothetical protein